MNAIKLKILSSGRSSRNGMVCKFFMLIEFGGSLRLSLREKSTGKIDDSSKGKFSSLSLFFNIRWEKNEW